MDKRSSEGKFTLDNASGPVNCEAVINEKMGRRCSLGVMRVGE